MNDEVLKAGKDCLQPITAEYVPGTGWMYVTEAGRFGNFDTKEQAITAGIAARGNYRSFGLKVQTVAQSTAQLEALYGARPKGL